VGKKKRTNEGNQKQWGLVSTKNSGIRARKQEGKSPGGLMMVFENGTGVEFENGGSQNCSPSERNNR